MTRIKRRKATHRTVGWITGEEQPLLRSKRVAVAGVGGVGGAAALALASVGMGALNLADNDRFEKGDISQEAGAFVNTVGRQKAEVMAEMVHQVSPATDVQVFSAGVTKQNVDLFLNGVDLFVDGFGECDLAMRAMTFARCATLRIPGIIAAPTGMGVSYLLFVPGRMTFEEYFRLDGVSLAEQRARWLLGLAPNGLHFRHAIGPNGTSTRHALSAACSLCGGVIAAEAVKLLLNHGTMYPAPYYHQWDVYRERFVRRRLPGGNRNPLQRLKVRYAAKALSSHAPSQHRRDTADA